ncbi:MAG: fatty acid--CoA ligase [Cytophagales bacterium]|nr:MAG: fatty acid--CoA ligase [Cytophagales bacterium]
MKVKKIAKANNAFQYPLLLKNLLNYSLMLTPENEIIYRDKVRYNYFEFNKRVRRLANLFKRFGIDGGETIAVMDYDSHRYLESYFAIPCTGNVLHTINWRLSASQILYTINHAEDTVILVHADFLPVLEGFASEMTTVKKIVVLTEDGIVPPTKLKIEGEYEQLLAQESEEYEFPDFDEDAVASTFYTTGTTGNPKGVFFSHRQIMLHSLGLCGTFGIIDGACRVKSSDTYMPLTPFFHVHGWGFPFLATAMGMKQVLVGKFEPEMVLKLFMLEKPTFSHCVPTILQMLVMHPAAQQLDLTRWKVIIGGSALPKALCRVALQRGVDIITGYGMSETCPILTTSFISPAQMKNDIEWQIEARTRAGIPAMMVDLKIIDDEGKEVSKDDQSMGEITARTPWLTQGYFNEPEKSEELWRGGYLHTGDVAVINEKNVVKIADRIKDVIKTGGEWISSIDLENLIGQHAAIAEVAVVGVPDAKWGERPHAMVVLKQGHSLSHEELKAFLGQFVESGTINKWAVPDTVDFTAAIPKTSVGKMDKKVIRGNLLKL